MTKAISAIFGAVIIVFCGYILQDATDSTYLFVGAGVEIPKLDRADYANKSQEEVLTRYIAMAHYANSLKYNGEVTVLQLYRWIIVTISALIVVTISLAVIVWRHSSKLSKKDALTRASS